MQTLLIFFFSQRGQDKTTHKLEQTKNSAKFHMLNSGNENKATFILRAMELPGGLYQTISVIR